MKRYLSTVMVLCVMQASVVCAGKSPVKLVVSEGFKNPIGFYDATPTFSWQQAATTVAQTAYRVVVASTPDLLSGEADLWDSGKIESDQAMRASPCSHASRSSGRFRSGMRRDAGQAGARSRALSWDC